MKYCTRHFKNKVVGDKNKTKKHLKQIISKKYHATIKFRFMSTSQDLISVVT